MAMNTLNETHESIRRRIRPAAWLFICSHRATNLEPPEQWDHWQDIADAEMASDKTTAWLASKELDIE
jgi:hypothetical protein